MLPNTGNNNRNTTLSLCNIQTRASQMTNYIRQNCYINVLIIFNLLGQYFGMYPTDKSIKEIYIKLVDLCGLKTNCLCTRARFITLNWLYDHKKQLLSQLERIKEQVKIKGLTKNNELMLENFDFITQMQVNYEIKKIIQDYNNNPYQTDNDEKIEQVNDITDAGNNSGQQNLNLNDDGIEQPASREGFNDLNVVQTLDSVPYERANHGNENDDNLNHNSDSNSNGDLMFNDDSSSNGDLMFNDDSNFNGYYNFF